MYRASYGILKTARIQSSTDHNMEERLMLEESFSIQFEGSAFKSHEISATALAQSLSALDSLSRGISESIYGKNTETEIKVKGGGRAGSFVVDLIVASFTADPLAATAEAVTIVGALFSVIGLAKWARGKRVNVVEENSNTVLVENVEGNQANYNRCVINVYNSIKVETQLSRLTQTLDKEGVERISLISDDSDGKRQEEVITKQERKYFKREEGIVLTDNESEMFLEVIGPLLNGSPKGWRFSEGDDGVEFLANVEDEEFLQAVKNREITLVNGTSIRALVRVVQRKTVRTVTERTITEVYEVCPPEEKKG